MFGKENVYVQPVKRSSGSWDRSRAGAYWPDTHGDLGVISAS